MINHRHETPVAKMFAVWFRDSHTDVFCCVCVYRYYKITWSWKLNYNELMMICNTIYSLLFLYKFVTVSRVLFGPWIIFYHISYIHTHTYIHINILLLFIQYTWKKNGNDYSKQKEKGFVSSRFLNKSCHAHALFSWIVCVQNKKKIDPIKKGNLLIDKINEGINQNGLMNKREIIITGVYRRHIKYIDPNFLVI